MGALPLGSRRVTRPLCDPSKRREDSEHSIFERSKDGGYRLRDNVLFHLYVSTSPCGDARLHSPYEITADRKHSPTRCAHDSPAVLTVHGLCRAGRSSPRPGVGVPGTEGRRSRPRHPVGGPRPRRQGTGREKGGAARGTSSLGGVPRRCGQLGGEKRRPRQLTCNYAGGRCGLGVTSSAGRWAAAALWGLLRGVSHGIHPTEVTVPESGHRPPPCVVP